MDGWIMPDCKIKIMVLMENVPDDKKLVLMDHIEKNIKSYNELIGCEIIVLA